MTQTARLYGGSLYDLAAEEQLTDVIQEQMQQLRKLFSENEDYLPLLAEPAIALDERKGLIEMALGTQVERYLVNFIKMLCERNLLGEYSACCDEFTRRYNADNGIAEAIVTSAVPLTKTQETALQEKLEKISGKRISLIRKINPAVMGGLRVELEGRQLEGTVQGRLSGISKKLQEIIV